jgi:hypothetical protein
MARPEGLFTILRCADGRSRVVMTKDWEVAQRLPAADDRGPDREGVV